MKIKFDDFTIKKCDITTLDEIIKIQDETFEKLEDTDILRKNSNDMLKECLNGVNVTIGAWYKDTLAGFSVLYFPKEDKENLALSLDGVDIKNLNTANYKLCIVREEFRGNNLQYELYKLIEKEAIKNKVDIICATVSPKNFSSINNVTRLGFLYNKTLTKYDLERNLYYKKL